MRYWKKGEVAVCEPDCADEWMELIGQVGVDYDGYNTVKELRSLIDELVEMSQKARRCLEEGKVFPEKKDELQRPDN